MSRKFQSIGCSVIVVRPRSNTTLTEAEYEYLTELADDILDRLDFSSLIQSKMSDEEITKLSFDVIDISQYEIEE
jgi:hypothetical protein